MGRKNRRKVEHIRKIHVNKYITKAGQKRKKSAMMPTSTPAQADAMSSIQPVHPIPKPHRGEIWYADLGDHYDTSVQSGSRPVLIISNDVANYHSSTVTALPMTTKFKKRSLPTHVMLPAKMCEVCSDEPQISQHLTEDSMILAEQVTTIDKTVLQGYLGKVINEQKLKEIDTAVAVQLGMASE